MVTNFLTLRILLLISALFFGAFGSFSQISTVDFEAFFNTDCLPLTRVRLYETGTSVLVIEDFDSFDSENQLTLTGLPYGTYDLFIRPENHLQKGFSNIQIADGETVEVGEFINGDITNDNAINIEDFSVFSSAFGSVMNDPTYVDAADLDCNGDVGISDFSTLSASFGIDGDEPPISDQSFCPELDLSVGDSCDDNDPNTINDMVNDNCLCEGENFIFVYPEGTINCASGPADVVEVLNPTTGKIWMDRNMGASQFALTLNDSLSYGDIYQWGRFSDGHQCRDSETTSSLSSSPQPEHDDFILSFSSENWDWLDPPNDNLWQGVNGVNNPCPLGYRIPTEAEWAAESASWNSNNASGAFGSPLRLPPAGNRLYFNDGEFTSVGEVGFYWSSTLLGFYAQGIYFNNDFSDTASYFRATGLSVRCIKD